MSETHIQKRTAEKKKEEEIGLPKKKTHKVQEEEEENKAGESKRGYQGAKTLLYIELNDITASERETLKFYEANDIIIIMFGFS